MQAAITRAQGSVAVVQADDGYGTAFYVGNSTWVTAAHVVRYSQQVTIFNARRSVEGTVVGVRKDLDLAVVEAPAIGRALEWGGIPTVGSTVIVMGYGRGQRTSNAGATRGIVSETFAGNGEEIWEDGATWVPEATYVRTDAPANPGNSGGPALNTCGKVVGVVLASRADAEGVHYAISGETAKASLQAVRDAGLPPDPAVAADALRHDLDHLYEWSSYLRNLDDDTEAFRSAEDELFTLYRDIWRSDYSEYSAACERASEWVAIVAYRLSDRAAIFALWYEEPDQQEWLGDLLDDEYNRSWFAMWQAEHHTARCAAP